VDCGVADQIWQWPGPVAPSLNEVRAALSELVALLASEPVPTGGTTRLAISASAAAIEAAMAESSAPFEWW